MAYHTYEFLKKRKNDPKWREDYLLARDDRLIALYWKLLVMLLLANVLVWVLAMTK